MLNNEYKTKAMKELENISAKELVNLLQEVGSTRVDDGNNVESDFKGDVWMLTKEELYSCAKKISQCCQYYRDNAKTNYCRGCPFFYNGSHFKGCILRDVCGNEVDNPGDWDLD